MDVIYALASGVAVVPAGAAPLPRQVPPPLPQALALRRRQHNPPDPDQRLQAAATHGGRRQVERDGHARHRHAGAGSPFLDPGRSPPPFLVVKESSFCGRLCSSSPLVWWVT